MNPCEHSQHCNAKQRGGRGTNAIFCPVLGVMLAVSRVCCSTRPTTRHSFNSCTHVNLFRGGVRIAAEQCTETTTATCCSTINLCIKQRSVTLLKEKSESSKAYCRLNRCLHPRKPRQQNIAHRVANTHHLITTEGGVTSATARSCSL
jgi:hypothetical protein